MKLKNRLLELSNVHSGPLTLWMINSSRLSNSKGNTTSPKAS